MSEKNYKSSEIKSIITEKRECVYFVLAEKLNRIKIGKTTEIYKRFRALNASSPCRLQVVCLLSGYTSLEAELHEKFKSYHIKHEWFEYTDEIKNYIKPFNFKLSNIFNEISNLNRRKSFGRKTEILSMRLESNELSLIREISAVLGTNVSRFIDMCIQEGMSNHSDFVKVINESGGQA